MRWRALCTAGLALLLAACGDARRHDGVEQTKAPGHLAAGGLSSGDVMAASAGRSKVEPGPAGTPGIPQGAGGNTSGAALGGTTPAAAPGTTAAANAAPASGAMGSAAPASAPATASAGAAPATAAAPIVPASAASTPAVSDAERQQRSLAAAMDVVAAHWRARAGQQGWAVHAATPIESIAGFAASATQTAPTGQPQGTLTAPSAQMPIRSEKLGTAPPSGDVKTATKPQPRAVLDPKSPESAQR
jgi:colicin import membrane protein